LLSLQLEHWVAKYPTDKEAEEHIRRQIDRLPRRLAAFVNRLRQPNSIWLRFPAAILLILGGFLWFLPIVGLWMLPLGLILLIEKFPTLKQGAVRLAMCIDERWFARH
jgi:hypothetical protein